jgi:hypothetical protein
MQEERERVEKRSKMQAQREKVCVFVELCNSIEGFG